MLPDTALPFRVSIDFAARVAAELYGLRATAHSLPGEYDDNFHLITENGGQYVLKIMHPTRERGFVEMQCAALQHLAAREPELSLPRVCTMQNGETIAIVADPDGVPRLGWMLTYVPGRLFAETRPHAPELLTSLGEMLGRISHGLADFTHPAAHRELKWDSARAGWIREYIHHIGDPARRNIVEQFMALYDAEVLPALPHLRRSVIYGDANDYNVLTATERGQLPRVVSVIDFGDMLHTITVAEAAIAAAYALLDKSDPLAAAANVVAGYHRTFPFTETEIALLFPLITTRLCVSVVNSAQRKTLAPDDVYITISERPAWAALEKLAAIPPRLAHYTFRAACGLAPVPHGASVVEWLRSNATSFAPMVDLDLGSALVFDLSVGSLRFGADPAELNTEALTETLFDDLRAAGTTVGIGRYDEARLIYTEPMFAAGP
ncbi:MAG: phosphotransferase, partial [Anaerolineales bacterium]